MMRASIGMSRSSLQKSFSNKYTTSGTEGTLAGGENGTSEKRCPILKACDLVKQHSDHMPHGSLGGNSSQDSRPEKYESKILSQSWAAHHEDQLRLNTHDSSEHIIA